MDRFVFVDKIELIYIFDCDGSWGGLLFIGVVMVKGVCIVFILMFESVYNLLV